MRRGPTAAGLPRGATRRQLRESERVLKRSRSVRPAARRTIKEECTDDTEYLLKCYDECKTWPGPGGAGRPVEYTWADIGYDGLTCGHGEPVPCYCATACPGLLGGDQGLIAGPCDADPPLTADTRGSDIRAGR